jgi:F0F1-type ATP synthase assembly protein I
LGTQFGEDLKTEREKEDLRQELSSLVQNLKNENEILKNKANKVYVYMIAGIVVGIVVGIALASIILKS